jgi:hypothetical protein
MRIGLDPGRMQPDEGEMNQWAALAKLEQTRDRREQRRHPRFVAHSINCVRGEVVNFSASGLRISYSRDMKFRVVHLVDLELYTTSGVHRCEAQVMWLKRVSRRQYDVGFRFTDPHTHTKLRLFENGFDGLSESMLDRHE